MEDYPAMLPLVPTIQHYDWGGHTFIPHLAGLKEPSTKPCAEWWIGAHHKAPSKLFLHGRHLALDEAIAEYPEYLLGREVNTHHHTKLPFLLKVLDVASMLSIQTHPSKAQAEHGYIRENTQGLPLEATQRVFKDDNHKPELMVALSDFYLLSGFRTPEQWASIRKEIPELQTLPVYKNPQDLKTLYQEVMTWGKTKIATWADRLKKRLDGVILTDKQHPDYWVQKALTLYGADPGLCSVYLLQLRHLSPGEGYFQGPGVLHAYLEGQNVEIMANSDNVFRGGLTSKHVDVDLLLEHVHYDYQDNGLTLPKTLLSGMMEYPVPVNEFRLLRVPDDHQFYPWTSSGPSILLPIQGQSAVRFGEYIRRLPPGQVEYVLPGEHIELQSAGDFFLASI